VNEISNLLEEKFECPRFPAHTQAVEWLIREVIQAGGSVTCCQRCNGFIRAKIASREVVPNVNTKSDFYPVSMSISGKSHPC